MVFLAFSRFVGYNNQKGSVGEMTEKREKYITELRAAYASMIRALFYSDIQTAEQTIEGLNVVSKLFLPEYARYIHEKELSADDTE